MAGKILTSPEEEHWYARAEKFEMIAPVKPSRPQEIIPVHHAMLPFSSHHQKRVRHRLTSSEIFDIAGFSPGIHNIALAKQDLTGSVGMKLTQLSAVRDAGVGAIPEPPTVSNSVLGGICLCALRAGQLVHR